MGHCRLGRATCVLNYEGRGQQPLKGAQVTADQLSHRTFEQQTQKKVKMGFMKSVQRGYSDKQSVENPAVDLSSFPTKKMLCISSTCDLGLITAPI